MSRPCGKLSELEDEGGMNENVEVEKKKERHIFNEKAERSGSTMK